jgi:DNA-binding MarR family transcriptional regulator
MVTVRTPSYGSGAGSGRRLTTATLADDHAGVSVGGVSTPPDPGLSAALRISVMRLSRRMRQERDDVGLSATHIAALATLERHGPLPLGELAAVEKVAPPSMTRVVARLAESALVDRARDLGDRRQVVITITEPGRQLLAADRRRRDEWLSARLRELPEADLEALSAVIPVLDGLAGA